MFTKMKNIDTAFRYVRGQCAEQTGMIQSAVSRFFSLKFKPTIDTFLQVSKAIKVNFFFEDQESKTDLNKCFEKAMEQLGRRVDKLPKN